MQGLQACSLHQTSCQHVEPNGDISTPGEQFGCTNLTRSKYYSSDLAMGKHRARGRLTEPGHIGGLRFFNKAQCQTNLPDSWVRMVMFQAPSEVTQECGDLHRKLAFWSTNAEATAPKDCQCSSNGNTISQMMTVRHQQQLFCCLEGVSLLKQSHDARESPENHRAGCSFQRSQAKRSPHTDFAFSLADQCIGCHI